MPLNANVPVVAVLPISSWSRPPVDEIDGASKPCELPGRAAIRREDEELRILPLEGHEGQVPTVRAPAYPATRSLAKSNLPLAAAIDVHDAHVWDSVLDGDVSNPSAIWGDMGCVRGAVTILGGKAEFNVPVALGQAPQVVVIQAIEIRGCRVRVCIV